MHAAGDSHSFPQDQTLIALMPLIALMALIALMPLIALMALITLIIMMRGRNFGFFLPVIVFTG